MIISCHEHGYILVHQTKKDWNDWHTQKFDHNQQNALTGIKLSPNFESFVLFQNPKYTKGQNDSNITEKLLVYNFDGPKTNDGISEAVEQKSIEFDVDEFSSDKFNTTNRYHYIKDGNQLVIRDEAKTGLKIY